MIGRILLGVVLIATAASAAATPSYDHYVRLTPENSVIGNYPTQKAPILTVKSGDTVKIDTGGGAGWRNPEMDPAEWLKKNNVPTSIDNPALKETLEVLEKTQRYADIK